MYQHWYVLENQEDSMLGGIKTRTARLALATAAIGVATALLSPMQAASAATSVPSRCPVEANYTVTHNYGNVQVPVGAPQANYNGTTSNEVSDFSAQVSGTVGFSYTASGSVSASVVVADVSAAVGYTVSISLTATLGNTVHVTAGPGRTAHAQYGVYRLETAGEYVVTQPTCAATTTAATTWSPHYVGWYTWLS
jgi:hypothetical protein